MANRDTPMGLRPAYHLTGGVMRTQRYKIASGEAVGIWRGDLVEQEATSRRITASAAATEEPFIGVFWGCRYRDTIGNYVYSKQWLAATATLGSEDAVAYVYDDPFIVFEIQCDGAFALTDIGQQADIVYAAGSTNTGNSAVELLSSDIGTGDNLHIVDLVERVGNDELTNNANVYVLINEHGLRNVGEPSIEEV